MGIHHYHYHQWLGWHCICCSIVVWFWYVCWHSMDCLVIIITGMQIIWYLIWSILRWWTGPATRILTIRHWTAFKQGRVGVPSGDALGGDLFYTSTLATSIPFPSYFSALRQNGARIFGIANAGTCVSTNCLFGSSRNNKSSPFGIMGCMPVWNQIL